MSTKKQTPRAPKGARGRPPGARSALPSNQCATIAERLTQLYGVQDKPAINAAIRALQKMVAPPQRAHYALLNYENVRKALRRLRGNQRWILSGPGVMLYAAAELSNAIDAAQAPKDELRTMNADIEAGLKLAKDKGII